MEDTEEAQEKSPVTGVSQSRRLERCPLTRATTRMRSHVSPPWWPVRTERFPDVAAAENASQVCACGDRFGGDAYAVQKVASSCDAIPDAESAG